MGVTPVRRLIYEPERRFWLHWLHVPAVMEVFPRKEAFPSSKIHGKFSYTVATHEGSLPQFVLGPLLTLRVIPSSTMEVMWCQDKTEDLCKQSLHAAVQLTFWSQTTFFSLIVVLCILRGSLELEWNSVVTWPWICQQVPAMFSAEAMEAELPWIRDQPLMT